MWFFVSEKDGQPHDSALTFVVFVILFNQRVRAYYVIHLYLYCKGRGLSSGHYRNTPVPYHDGATRVDVASLLYHFKHGLEWLAAYDIRFT